MDLLFRILIILHIAGGSVGLVFGLVNIVAKKGDSQHKLVGKLFSYGMMTAGLTALMMSIIHPNPFLFMVGVFTIYMVATGNRYLKMRKKGKSAAFQLIDKLYALLMLICGAGFVVYGLLLLLNTKMFGVVFVMLGFFSLMFVRRDWENFSGKSKVMNYWLTAHLQRMMGAFIASLTAFLVVNQKYFPEAISGVVYWLLPSAIITPLIVKWSRKYEVRRK